MHAENIEAAKREVLRLLRHTGDVLKGVTNSSDLLHKPDPKQPRQIDTHKAEKWRSTLRNEIEKVKNLEAIFAVVGTVKAGKSTTINAIVGAEILPNRPEPMTTYPTLVRHKPGQTEPVLDFPVARSFNSLVCKAKKKLTQQTGKTPLDRLYPDLHEQEIAKKILEDKLEIAARSEGKAEIFESLKTVNDLYRLCGRLELDLPATAVRMPTLEIEMHHIGASDTGVGWFAVLDLPGPNEFGQSERLREIVQTQLSRASAVVLVSDFTQRKTQADEEIQRLVKDELPRLIDQLTDQPTDRLIDRLFIFVNKFDQRRADDWDEEETRQYLAKTLLNGHVKPEHIYPVSALKAFLANWAQRQLKESGQLPGPEASSLTKDFGKAAFGEMWEDDIEQLDRVQTGADRLWKRSLFADPLDNVIRVAARNASLLCLEAATAKLLDYNQRLDSFLKIRDSATTKHIKTLQAEIDNLGRDIEKISEKEQASRKKMEDTLGEFNDLIRIRSKDWSDQIQQIIKHYFERGELRPPPTEKPRLGFKKVWDQLGEWVSKWLRDEPFPLPPSPQTGQDFSPGETLLEYRGDNHEAQAKEAIEYIRDRIQPVYDKAATYIEQKLNEASEGLSKQIAGELEEGLRDILEQAKKRLQRDFNIELTFPEHCLKIDIETLQSLDPDIVEQKEECVTTRHKNSGIWAEVARFFGEILEQDWGYERIQQKHEISTINLAVLRDSAMKHLGRFSSEMQDRAKELAQTQKKALSDYFDDLKDYLEAFRGDLLDACQDKQRETHSLEERHNRIQEFLSEVRDIEYDRQRFSESLGVHNGAERPS